MALLALFSCSEKSSDAIANDITPVPARYNFGFNLSDYNIVNDTVKSGDTFGGILGKQNLDTLQVHEIVTKIKDTFDVRRITKGKPYTLLRTLDRRHKLQAFIYQPDRLTYYVVDLRDSIYATQKKKPVTFRRRTVAGALNGSLADALDQEHVDPELATRISKIYQWSIDFFKLQKGDKFGVTFTERFVNDTVYDGVDSLQAAFFEYKGKIIYAFPFAQETSGKTEYYDEEGKLISDPQSCARACYTTFCGFYCADPKKVRLHS